MKSVHYKTMMILLMLSGAVYVTAIIPAPVMAHCQIPCGIYGDQTRFDVMLEHITTIEKSMKQIEALSADPGANANQLVRWVNNKDEHAEKFEEIITYYFLQQRIKPVEKDAEGYGDYLEKLRICHDLLINSMKSKQTTDLQYVEKLRSGVEALRKAYFEADAEKHLSQHHGGHAESHG